MPLRAVIVGCSLLLAFAAVSVRADTGAILLPPECGTAEVLRARVRELVGAADERAFRDVIIHVQARAGGGYRLDATLPHGTRSLEERACADLVAAAALMVAASSTPADPPPRNARESTAESPASDHLSTPAPAGAVEVLSAPRSSPADPVPPRPAPPPRLSNEVGAQRADTAVASRRRAQDRAWLVAGGAGVSTGIVPAVSAQLDAQLLARLARAELLFALRYLFPREAEAGSGGVRVQALAGSLVVGYALLAWLRLGLGGDLWALHGTGSELSGARSDWALTFAPRAELWVRALRSAHAELSLGAAGLYQARPARFQSAGGTLHYASESWAFHAGVRAAWEFF